LGWRAGFEALEQALDKLGAILRRQAKRLSGKVFDWRRHD
jgi:hypothetical protein